MPRVRRCTSRYASILSTTVCKRDSRCNRFTNAFKGSINYNELWKVTEILNRPKREVTSLAEPIVSDNKRVKKLNLKTIKRTKRSLLWSLLTKTKSMFQAAKPAIKITKAIAKPVAQVVGKIRKPINLLTPIIKTTGKFVHKYVTPIIAAAAPN